jgi:hypothetical protein
MSNNDAIAGESCREVVDIWLADRGLRTQHADDPGLAELRSGLDSRNGADNWYVKRVSDVVQGDRRRSIAGNDGESRAVTLDQAAEERRDPGGDLSLRPRAIRESSTVGRVDNWCGGK